MILIKRIGGGGRHRGGGGGVGGAACRHRLIVKLTSARKQPFQTLVAW